MKTIIVARGARLGESRSKLVNGSQNICTEMQESACDIRIYSMKADLNTETSWYHMVIFCCKTIDCNIRHDIHMGNI